jgi:hypothetical protein
MARLACGRKWMMVKMAALPPVSRAWLKHGSIGIAYRGLEAKWFP